MKQSSQLLLILHFCLYAISPRGLALFDLPSSWPIQSLHFTIRHLRWVRHFLAGEQKQLPLNMARE
jgi:hypothetical protein